MEEVLAKVEAALENSKRAQAIDGVFYNGGVVFTLLCTGVATIIGAINNSQDPVIPLWVAPLLSGLATIWVGIDRALQFGSRWRFHRSISAAHRSLRNRLLSLSMVPEEKRVQELEAIRETFVTLPALDPKVPGVPSPEGGED